MFRLPIDQAVQRLAQRLSEAPEARLFVPFGPGEPLGLRDRIKAMDGGPGRVCFVGAPIPGINRTDWSALREGATSEGIFVSADWRPAFEAGRYALRPLTWFQTFRWLGETPLDAAVFMVSPPGPDGRVTLSVASDLAPAVLNRSDVFKLALVNPDRKSVV